MAMTIMMDKLFVTSVRERVMLKKPPACRPHPYQAEGVSSTHRNPTTA
jgi:hypothetical protein